MKAMFVAEESQDWFMAAYSHHVSLVFRTHAQKTVKQTVLMGLPIYLPKCFRYHAERESPEE